MKIYGWDPTVGFNSEYFSPICILSLGNGYDLVGSNILCYLSTVSLSIYLSVLTGNRFMSYFALPMRTLLRENFLPHPQGAPLLVRFPESLCWVASCVRSQGA